MTLSVNLVELGIRGEAIQIASVCSLCLVSKTDNPTFMEYGIDEFH